LIVAGRIAMRHAILGAGGIGGLFGAALAHEGEDVTLVVRAEAMAGYPEMLTLESPFGNVSVPVKHASSVAEPFDVLWITVKATQLEAALRSVTINKERIGAVVPLLNGVDHMARLRAQFGEERVVAAAIRVESERVGPGRIEHRSPFARLTIASSGRARLQTVVDKLARFGFACQFEDNEATLLWSKLVFLGPFALTSTAGGMNKGEMTNDATWRGRFEASVREACAVAVARGAKVDAAAVMAFFDALPPHMRSSMQKDVAAGNEPELDAIAGPILRGAEAHGIAVPVTGELVRTIRARG
jgi:2-dehydropantoate 2-reductase